MYALVDWEEEGTSSVVSLTTVVRPKKELKKYQVGENITCRYQRQLYKAVIESVSEDGIYLEERLDERVAISTDEEEAAQKSCVPRKKVQLLQKNVKKSAAASRTTQTRKKVAETNQAKISVQDSEDEDDDFRFPSESSEEEAVVKSSTLYKKIPTKTLSASHKDVVKQKKEEMKKTTKKVMALNEKRKEAFVRDMTQGCCPNPFDLEIENLIETENEENYKANEDNDEAETCTTHPKFGGKMPRFNFCVKCSEKEIELKKLRKTIESLQKQLEKIETNGENNKALPKPGKVSKATATKYGMVELVMGSGVYMGVANAIDFGNKVKRHSEDAPIVYFLFQMVELVMGSGVYMGVANAIDFGNKVKRHSEDAPMNGCAGVRYLMGIFFTRQQLIQGTISEVNERNRVPLDKDIMTAIFNYTKQEIKTIDSKLKAAAHNKISTYRYKAKAKGTVAD